MKALALFSGGLDSVLAIKVLLEQGIEVEAVSFTTPFTHCIDREAAGGLGVRLRVISVSEEYLDIVKSPRYGYGKNLNPCVDCKILMYRKASGLMKETGALFVVTGDVLGQRPMTQRRNVLNIIDRDSGLKGLVLRPLSAKLLPLTIPEEKGWVDRSRLLDIQGRSRKAQLQLAEGYNIRDYLTPGGGCLLTDSGFSQRVKDLMSHSGLSLEDVGLLKVGRHFRINSKARLVVGRNEKENEKLKDLVKPGDIYFSPVTDKGPAAIGRGEFGNGDILSAGRIVARYCDGHKNGRVKVGSCLWPGGEEEVVSVEALEENEIHRLRI